MVTKKVDNTKHIVPDNLEKMQIKVKIKGDSDLLVNAMSDETKQDLKDKYEGKKTQRKNRDFTEEARTKIHYAMVKGKKQPALFNYAFKKGMVETSVYLGGMSKKLTNSIQVVSVDGSDLIPFTFSKMTLDERWVRPRMGPPMPVIRPRFKDWSCEFIIQFDKNVITPETIINLLNKTGFMNGVGSFSPRCGGSFGMYSIQQTK
jgi:hypothetical protein